MTPTDALGHDLLTAYSQLLVRRARRRRTVLVSTVAVAGVLVLGTAALGAAHLLGWPAPEHVRKDIAAVNRGLPEDLRLNPDVEHARAVAATANGTLYAASLKDGGSCTEIVTAGERGRGATCSTAADREQQPIGLVAPFDDGAGPDAPIVLGGRVNDPDASSLEAVYGDGTHEQVALGDDRYYLLEVPADDRASVHESGMELVALGAFNHAIVSTVELVFGMRYGAGVSTGQLLANLGLAVAGNLAGGLLLVTFARTAQALGASADESS